MALVFLLYGLSFIMLGGVLALEGRLVAGILSRRCLWLLALFGLLHGATEWVAMARLVSGDAGPGWLGWMRLALNAVSFAALLQFGIELHIDLRRFGRWMRVLPGALLVLIGVAALGGGLGPSPSLEVLVRYLIALPAALLAAVGLAIEARLPARPGESQRTRRLMLGAAVGFAAYAVFAGLLGPRAAFVPASFLNEASFRAVTGLPVELFRAACAAVIAGFLTEAFVIEASRQQEHMKRLRADAIFAVAHDLRAPLSAIVLQTQLLERRLPADDYERNALARIRGSTRSLNRMVTDLFDVSGLETRQLKVTKERVDLARLVRDVVGRADAELAGRPLRVHLTEPLPAVEADAGRLEQVLINLLSNAGKYSDPDTEIDLTAEPKDDLVLVSVTNTGPGIPQDELPKIFTPFYRAKAVEGHKPGLGLGLFIVKGLIETHGGRVWVESDVDARKTAFRFELPALPAS